MTINGILYDNDGTLVDTHDLILSSFQHATRTVFGKALPEKTLMKKVGQPLHVQVKDFTDDENVQKALLEQYRKHNKVHHIASISAFDGIKQALDEIHKLHIAQAVVTSKRSDVATEGLEHLELLPYLDFVVGYDHTSKHKPNPEPIVFGARKLGVPVNECLYVGDSPFDIQAGNDAGCTTVGVLWGMFSKTELEEMKPDYIIEKPFELVELAQTLCPKFSSKKIISG